MPNSDPPGWESLPISPVFMSKKRAVRALRMAMSIEPSQAPSMRANAFRLAPASTTAMFILAPICSRLRHGGGYGGIGLFKGHVVHRNCSFPAGLACAYCHHSSRAAGIVKCREHRQSNPSAVESVDVLRARLGC